MTKYSFLSVAICLPWQREVNKEMSMFRNGLLQHTDDVTQRFFIHPNDVFITT